MATRYYVVPALLANGVNQPKYFTSHYDSQVGTFPSDSNMDFGLLDIFIVRADLSAAQNTTINGRADAFLFPLNLDTTLGAGALATIVNALENRFIPGTGRIVSGTTYRELLRFLMKNAFLHQRFAALFSQAIQAGITLDTTFNQLPAPAQNRLVQLAQNYNFDTSGLSGASTLRQILAFLADQFLDRTCTFGDVVI